MSENINEVLNITLETSEKEDDEVFLNDEKKLKVIADIILFVGIISSSILLFTIAFIQVGEHSWEHEVKLNASGLVTTLCVLFTSIATWAFFRVVSNISISLKELNRKKSKK